MIKYYETVDFSKGYDDGNQFTLYSGYDIEEAKDAAVKNWNHLTKREQQKRDVEVRVFELERAWEEYDSNERCDIYMIGYNTIEWK